jgi:hypothetical protein
MDEQKYIIENGIDVPNEANTYHDTLTNLSKMIATTWGKTPHRVVKHRTEDGTDYTHWEVRKLPEDPKAPVLGGEILFTFILTRAETLPLLPEHL